MKTFFTRMILGTALLGLTPAAGHTAMAIQEKFQQDREYCLGFSTQKRNAYAAQGDAAYAGVTVDAKELDIKFRESFEQCMQEKGGWLIKPGGSPIGPTE